MLRSFERMVAEVLPIAKAESGRRFRVAARAGPAASLRDQDAILIGYFTAGKCGCAFARNDDVHQIHGIRGRNRYGLKGRDGGLKARD